MHTHVMLFAYTLLSRSTCTTSNLNLTFGLLLLLRRERRQPNQTSVPKITCVYRKKKKNPCTTQPECSLVLVVTGHYSEITGPRWTLLAGKKSVLWKSNKNSSKFQRYYYTTHIMLIVFGFLHLELLDEMDPHAASSVKERKRAKVLTEDQCV